MQSASLFPLTWYWSFIGIALIGGGPHAAGAIRDSFETLEPSWRLVEKDCPATVLAHQRALDQAHSGQASEYLRLQCGRGTIVYLSHPIPPASVIDELVPSVWVKSDRPGLQFLVRVVLPRAVDPNHGGPLRTLIFGTTYQAVGSWQRLYVDELPLRLSREQRYLRQRFGSHVDIREAYVDLVVLNAYSQPGTNEVWIDDLEVQGHVSVDQPADFAGRPTPTAHVESATEPGLGSSGPHPVRLSQSVLEVAGRPMFARLLDYNGESLEWLRSLGFNAVKLANPPTDLQLEEAKRTGMWLVAPPPNGLSELTAAEDFDPVLAWNLGCGTSERAFEECRQSAALLRSADPRVQRPIVCDAAASLWQYSGLANILLFNKSVIGTSFEMREFSPWLRDRIRVIRSGTPIWVTIQTEAAVKLCEQGAVLAQSGISTGIVEPDQIRLLVYQAIGVGARGIHFQSRARLDAIDPATRLRAAVLQLLNLEISALEPWAAGGVFLEELPTSDPDVQVAVLQTERSRLFIASRRSAGQQFVAGPSPDRKVSLADSGASRSAKAFRFATPSGLQQVRRTRQQTGLRLTLDNVDPIAVVVQTDDALVVDHLQRRPTAEPLRAAQLQHDIASQWFRLTIDILQHADQLLVNELKIHGRLQEVQSNLQRSESLLRSGDSRGSAEFSTAAVRSLAGVRRHLWQEATKSFSSPSASPYCRSFESLPQHWALSRRFQHASWSGNLLAAGDFESPEAMRQSGWQHETHERPIVRAVVELSPQAAKSGKMGLRLMTSSTNGLPTTDVLETALIQVRSPPVPVRPGQLVRIHGWANLAHPVRGSHDGLLIDDSIGDLTLAERIRPAGGWQEFTLYRVAPGETEVTVRFTLAGLADVGLDEVTIMVADPPIDLSVPRGSTTIGGVADFLMSR